ncbi:TPA: hypothetical protein ACKP22_002876 [Pseudomonas putida]
MEIDRSYRFIGHRGVTFDVIEFTVRADNCCWLNTLHNPTAGRHQYRVVGKVKELYERMQAGQLPCVMVVAVSLPLTREQGDALNAQRWTVAALVSAGGGCSYRDVRSGVGSWGGKDGYIRFCLQPSANVSRG